MTKRQYASSHPRRRQVAEAKARVAATHRLREEALLARLRAAGGSLTVEVGTSDHHTALRMASAGHLALDPGADWEHRVARLFAGEPEPGRES